MSALDHTQQIKLIFPDATLREATELAEELRLELIAAGADSRDVQLTRTSADSMDLGSAVLFGLGYFAPTLYELFWKAVEGGAKEFGARSIGKLWEIIEEFCSRKQTNVCLQHPDGRQLTFGRSGPKASKSTTDSRETAVVIIIGASNYPLAPSLDNPAFSRSAEVAREIFSPRKLLHSKTALLDLFDADVDGASLVRAIRRHLEQHARVRDVVLYYCGHGMAASGRKTALTLRGYSPTQGSTTTLRLEDLREDLEDLLTEKRLYMFFDCCFAGGARDAFQPPNRRFDRDTNTLPARGWAALVASGRDERAISPANQTLTMFTEALSEVVTKGDATRSTTLSLKTLDTAMRERIKSKHAHGDYELPQSHEYWPEAGYILDIPLFRNAAVASDTANPRHSFPSGAQRTSLPTKAVEASNATQVDASPRRVALPTRPPKFPGLPTVAVSDDMYLLANSFFEKLMERDYLVGPSGRLTLTRSGNSAFDAFAAQERIDPKNKRMVYYLLSFSHSAHKWHVRDRDYIVRGGNIHVIDKASGAPNAGQRFADGFHQAIEAKERVEISPHR